MDFKFPSYIKMGFKPNGGGMGHTYLKCIKRGSSTPSEEIVLLRTIYGVFFISVCNECKNPLREIINSTPHNHSIINGLLHIAKYVINN